MSTAKLAKALFCIMSTLIFPVLSFGQISQAIRELTEQVQKVNSQVASASPETKAKLDDALRSVPKPILPTANPPEYKQIELAAEADRIALCSSVTQFIDQSQSHAQNYSNLALGSIILSAFMALVGSVASFLSKNKTAGVIGLTVASIVGLSNAYPVGPLANFYLSLAGQARALKVDCEFARPYTVTTYTSDVSQFKLLYVTEEKRPSFGSPRLATDELANELQQIKTASNNVTVAQK